MKRLSVVLVALVAWGLPGATRRRWFTRDPDLQAIFIASGRGIRPGVTLDTVNNIDIAPTAARLLDLELKDVQGRLLGEILIQDQTRMPR